MSPLSLPTQRCSGQCARTGTPRHTLGFITHSDIHLYREGRQAAGLEVAAGDSCQRWGSLFPEHWWLGLPPSCSGWPGTSPEALFVCTAHPKDQFWQAGARVLSRGRVGASETQTLSCWPVSLGWQSPIMTLFWALQDTREASAPPVWDLPSSALREHEASLQLGPQAVVRVLGLSSGPEDTCSHGGLLNSVGARAPGGWAGILSCPGEPGTQRGGQLTVAESRGQRGWDSCIYCPSSGSFWMEPAPGLWSFGVGVGG